MRLVLIGALLVGCGAAQAPGSSPMPNRVRWDSEPVVCSPEVGMDAYIQTALAAWGWGKFTEDCAKADIVVRTDRNLEGSIIGLARWKRGSQYCTIGIRRLSQFVISHEVGHCMGLGHSEDKLSVMYPTYDDERMYRVTGHDRAVLGKIKK